MCSLFFHSTSWYFLCPHAVQVCNFIWLRWSKSPLIYNLAFAFHSHQCWNPKRYCDECDLRLDSEEHDLQRASEEHDLQRASKFDLSASDKDMKAPYISMLLGTASSISLFIYLSAVGRRPDKGRDWVDPRKCYLDHDHDSSASNLNLDYGEQI